MNVQSGFLMVKSLQRHVYNTNLDSASVLGFSSRVAQGVMPEK